MFEEKMYQSRILEVRQETPDTKSIRFEKPAGFDYMPGQYAIFEYQLNDELVRRSYSFSSSPTEPFLQVTVKHVPQGKMSTYLCQIGPGETLKFNGPVGKFMFSPNITDVVFIAGGSGISPFRSMLKFIFDNKLDTKATLIYGSRTPKEIILVNELEEDIREYLNFRLFLTVDHPDEDWHFHTGFINADFIKEATQGNVLGKVYFLCGPPLMVTSVKKALIELSVAEECIKLDAWG